MALRSVSRRNCRATVQRPPDRDGYTPTSDDWVAVTSLWVYVRPLRGDERYVDPGYGALVMYEVESNYDRLVQPQMRIVYRDKKLHIQSVIDEDQRRVDMKMMCSEIV